MGNKIFLTGLAIYLIAQAFSFPAANVVSAIFAVIGIILIWLDR